MNNKDVLQDEVLFINELENAVDSLKLASQTILASDKYKWKWITLSVHHSFYSFCIACQSQGNFDNVLSEGEDDKDYYILKGNNKYYKKPVKDYLDNSPTYRIKWETTEYCDSNPPPIKQKRKKSRKKLISFWTALARVQDPWFWMGKKIHLKALNLSDPDILEIVWFTYLRNEFMHFIPTTYGISIERIKSSCNIALDSIRFLAFESNAISRFSIEPELLVRTDKLIQHIQIELK